MRNDTGGHLDDDVSHANGKTANVRTKDCVGTDLYLSSHLLCRAHWHRDSRDGYWPCIRRGVHRWLPIRCDDDNDSDHGDDYADHDGTHEDDETPVGLHHATFVDDDDHVARNDDNYGLSDDTEFVFFSSDAEEQSWGETTFDGFGYDVFESRY